MEMYNVIQSFFGEMISRGRNAQRENVLHYICRRNKYYLMVPFLVNGCRLSEQDFMGRTPVHVALENGHEECLQEFLKILKIYDKLKEVTQKDILRVFHVYNHNGLTILHETVLHDKKDLIKDMLNFCIKTNLNVVDHEVLGTGDTLLHLIARKNRLEMGQIVCDFLPQLLTRENYAGILPQDAVGVSEEMKELFISNMKLNIY